jgi:ribonucleoside-diphosphate reductase alpha chain
MHKDIYWLNKDSRKFLERGYLLEGETAEQRIADIAKTAERYLKLKGFADKFEEYLKLGYYSLSSPIWSNFGRNRGLPISCFGSYVNDDMDDILYKMAEVGVMSKVGGGTSGYFGDIRPRGAKISSGGEATGVHHQLTVFESLTNYISQGNVRRGSFAAYLPIDHPDIEEFLKIRGEGDDIQNLSIGVCVSDEWMKSMMDGDRDKRAIWASVIKKRFESGYPYIFFTDNANNQAPQVYKDKGLKINNSNLCVTGDTKIEILIDETEYLEIPIKDLEFYQRKSCNIKVKSYDIETKQEVYSEITAFAQTGESVDLIEIEDEQGNIIKCTPEHQIYTQNRGYVQAQDLREDDNLVNITK